MVPYLFLLLLGSKSEAVQSHNDSLLIYNAYKQSIEVLKNVTDLHEWYAYEDSLSQITACAFLRLSKYNKKTYAPADEFNREGVGEAFAFPKPSDVWFVDSQNTTVRNVPEMSVPIKKENKVVAIPSSEPIAKGPIAFTVLDRQTHFLVTNNGKTKTPYIEMYYYAKGRVLVKTEKLNPVTLKPIVIPTEEARGTTLVMGTE